MTVKVRIYFQSQDYVPNPSIQLIPQIFLYFSIFFWLNLKVSFVFILFLVYQLIIQCKRMQGPKSGSISALGQSMFLIYLDIWALRNFFNFHSISSCKKVLKLQTASGCAEFRSRLLEGEFLNPIWTKWKFHFDLSLSMLQWVLA